MEDDATTALALSTILRRRGLKVEVASTLAGAFDMLTVNPAFVILDLMLPDGDGVEILKYLRHSNSPIKVIVTTAINDTARLSHVRELQPQLILQKPIDLDRLIHALERMN